MTDRDELAAAFDALRVATLPKVRRPGVAAVQRTVRTRRTRRRLGGTIGAAFLTVAALGLPGMQADKPRPDETPAPTPSASTPAPNVSTSTSPLPGPPNQPGATGSRRPPPGPVCMNGAMLFDVDLRWPDLRVYKTNYEQPAGCQGDVAHVMVAMYSIDDANRAQLYSHERVRLDAQTPEHTFVMQRPGCHWAYYVVGDRTPVPLVSTFAAPASGYGNPWDPPYADHRRLMDIGYCPPAPPTTPPPPTAPAPTTPPVQSTPSPSPPPSDTP